MPHWEFEHHAQHHRQFWEWRAYRSDGRVYRHSARHFSSFLRAFEDASHHGFDKARHPWTLATPTYRPSSDASLTRGHRPATARGHRRRPQ
jgi:hypothetical protein